MKKARLILRILFGIMFLLTAAGLIYTAVSFTPVSDDDKFLIAFAPLYAFIGLTVLVSEVELFFFFRPKSNSKVLPAEIFSVLLAALTILLAAAVMIIEPDSTIYVCISDVFAVTVLVYWPCYVVLKILIALRKDPYNYEN